MYLTDTKILEYGKQLVEPFIPDLVGPNSLDVRLSNEFLTPILKSYISQASHIYDPREDAGQITDNPVHWDYYKGHKYVLQPGQFVLASTVEKLTLPSNVLADIKGKSTVGRTGLSVEFAGFIDSGFHGNVTLEIVNHLPFAYTLHAGQLIAQIRFMITDPPKQDYSVGHSYYEQTGPTRAKTDKLYRYCEFD